MLKTQQFIEKNLSKAGYKFDDSVKEWVGWIRGFPGIYAQGKTIEEVRGELSEMLEEYLFISLREGKQIQELGIKAPRYVQAYQPQRAY